MSLNGTLHIIRGRGTGTACRWEAPSRKRYRGKRREHSSFCKCCTFECLRPELRANLFFQSKFWMGLIGGATQLWWELFSLTCISLLYSHFGAPNARQNLNQSHRSNYRVRIGVVYENCLFSLTFILLYQFQNSKLQASWSNQSSPRMGELIKQFMKWIFN
jgi:hypothetical protein